MLGSARRVIADKDQTTIIEGAGSVSDVKARINQIKQQAENATSEYDKENLEKRVAALDGKVAVIKVGGATETEIEEKKFRVDDAVAATKAALDEGVVAGGGVTLVNIAAKLGDDDDAGFQLLKNALVQPFKHLMSNAGLNADEKLPQVVASKSAGQGFDVTDATKLVDMKKAGIVDPATVTREAIQNAVSIAATGMTMGGLVVDIPEKAAAAPAAPDMGGMGMM
jgi:chaperonin GroEL